MWRGGTSDIGWVFGENSSKAEADASLQKFLYLGVFPMAPFPQSDHAIVPNPRADELYLDYGPLFQAMRGKKWVLLPHVLSVDAQGVKANVFQVPEGYVVPITFGASAPMVKVTIRGIPEILAAKKLKCEQIHPGETQWQSCVPRISENTITQEVPLRRGCAMVRLGIE